MFENIKSFAFSDVNIHSQVLLSYHIWTLNSFETRPHAISYPESLDTRLCINLKTVWTRFDIDFPEGLSS